MQWTCVQYYKLGLLQQDYAPPLYAIDAKALLGLNSFYTEEPMTLDANHLCPGLVRGDNCIYPLVCAVTCDHLQPLICTQ